MSSNLPYSILNLDLKDLGLIKVETAGLEMLSSI